MERSPAIAQRNLGLPPPNSAAFIRAALLDTSNQKAIRDTAWAPCVRWQKALVTWHRIVNSLRRHSATSMSNMHNGLPVDDYSPKRVIVMLFAHQARARSAKRPTKAPDAPRRALQTLRTHPGELEFCRLGSCSQTTLRSTTELSAVQPTCKAPTHPVLLEEPPHVAVDLTSPTPGHTIAFLQCCIHRISARENAAFPT